MPDIRYLNILFLSAFIVASPQGLASGESLFQQNCSSCHGVGAIGTPGLAPPLKNPELWQSLGSQASLYYLVGVVTNGMSGKLEVDGQVYQGLVMPPLAHIESSDLVNIADYVLSDLNGLSVTTSESDVEALQNEPMNHGLLRAKRSSAGGGNEQ
ncbi:c-type cytochrome [Vreelandella arctica]|uniref:c-type cytochrome n=1 Tax=Vreelandella arctica TaxID=3126499 RepID=UPI000C0D526B|nr:cytochrome c [Halomonas sp.]MBL1268039.1 cytochrome c [Halomonas sp.]